MRYMGFRHFLYKKVTPEFFMATASICVKVGVMRVIW